MMVQVFTPKDEPRLGIYANNIGGELNIGTLLVAESEELLRAWFPDAEIHHDPSVPAFPYMTIVDDAVFRQAVIDQINPPDPTAYDFIGREVEFLPDDEVD